MEMEFGTQRLKGEVEAPDAVDHRGLPQEVAAGESHHRGDGARDQLMPFGSSSC